MEVGGITPFASHTDVVGKMTPSSKQNTSLTFVPTPHDTLQADQGPTAYEYTWMMGASRGYGGLGVGVIDGVVVTDSVTLGVSDADPERLPDPETLTECVTVTLTDTGAVRLPLTLPSL